MTPLIDAAVDLLLGYPKGLTKPEASKRLGWSEWTTREVFRQGRLMGRLACVYFGHSHVRWTAAPHGPALTKQAQDESSALATTRRQRKREKAKRAEPGKLYDNPEFNEDVVPDLPVRQTRPFKWTPITVAPGPTSVFDLGAQ